MENYEQEFQEKSQLPDENQFFANPQIAGYLLTTSKWGKFLAIVGYVVMALMIVFGIFIFITLSFGSPFPEPGFMSGIMGFFYVIVGALYFIPVTNLLRYSMEIKKGIDSNDMQSINSGFRNLKSLFKFIGIFTVVTLALYAIIVIVLILSLLFSGFL